MLNSRRIVRLFVNLLPKAQSLDANFSCRGRHSAADHSLSHCSDLITVAPIPNCTNSSDENYQICIPAGNSEVEFGLLDLLLESKLIYG